MSCTIDKILTDARTLLERLKEHDTAAESLIDQSAVLHRRVAAMREAGAGCADQVSAAGPTPGRARAGRPDRPPRLGRPEAAGPTPVSPGRARDPRRSGPTRPGCGRTWCWHRRTRRSATCSRRTGVSAAGADPGG